MRDPMAHRISTQNGKNGKSPFSYYFGGGFKNRKNKKIFSVIQKKESCNDTHTQQVKRRTRSRSGSSSPK
jgi:hypothetical protein